jgi:hypothetical protein
MELEMYLNGKFIDAIPVLKSQLSKIHELQHQLEKKYCHELEYSDDQPEFFISGIPSDMDEMDKRKLREGLRHSR